MPRRSRLTPAISQVQVVDLGNAAGAVDRHVGLEAPLASAAHAPHDEPGRARVDAGDVDAQLHLDAELARALDEQVHEIRSKPSSGRAPRCTMVTSAPARAATCANSNEM